MTTKLYGRLAIVLLAIVTCYAKVYPKPHVNIQALTPPKGLRMWVEDTPHLRIVGVNFHWNYNRKFSIYASDYLKFLSEPINGTWFVENNEQVLKKNDTIYYNVQIFGEELGLIFEDNLSYVVDEHVDASSPLVPTNKGTCLPTATVVRGGGTACAGQLIFEDNFDNLNETNWQIEQYIPVQHPEHPFVSYQRLQDDPTVSVANGTLQIVPKLLENVPGFSKDTISSGSLNLFSGCTAAAESCVHQASGADIIPPVVSGRLTSKNFAFTYGTVIIRAKVPQGDWLYPDLLLEPLIKKYGGDGYDSGLLRIAGARGNTELVDSESKDYSNKVLYGGLIMDYQCRDAIVGDTARKDGSLWGDDFHIYLLRWTPERITLTVDWSDWFIVEPKEEGGLAAWLPDTCRQLPNNTLLAKGSKMAPFDDHFTISLGLGAGGVTEFPDGTTSENTPKPWTNQGRKAILNFWEDMAAWTSTWDNPELLIDYVKVFAL